MSSEAILAAAHGKSAKGKTKGDNWQSKLAAQLQPEAENDLVFKPRPGQTFFEDVDYQTALVGLLCKDTEVLRRCSNLLLGKDFRPVGVSDPTSLYRWVIAERALRFWNKYNQPICQRLKSELMIHAKESGMDSKKREDLIAYATRLLSRKIVGADDIVQHAIQYKRELVKATALEELIELQASGKLTDYEWSRISDKTISALSEGGNTAPTTAAALLQQDFPEPAYLVNPMMPRGLTMLAARPKAGKSWLALQLGIAVATNGQFLGRKIKTPGPVLYAALEDGQRRIRERIGMLLGESIDNAEVAEKMGLIKFLFDLPPLQAGGLHQLERQLKEAQQNRAQCSLLVIDHFLAAAGELKGRDIVRGEYKEIAALRSLSERYSLAIVLVHHLRKQPAADSGETVIGTTGITAAVDSLWLLTPGNDDKTKRLEIKGRDIKEQTIEMKLMFTASKHGWQVVDEGAVVKAGPTGQKILKHLRRHGPRGPREIAETLNLEYGNVRENLHRLHGRGLVLKEGKTYAYPGK